MISLTKYIIGITAVTSIVILLLSCTKSFDEKTTQQNDFNNSTLAQVFVATVGAVRNYVYIDGKNVTGAVVSAGGVFPSSAYSFVVSPGLRSFLIKDTLASSTQVPLVFAENMQVGRNYTIFTYDTITSPKQLTVQNDIVVPAGNGSRIRFANFIYNTYAIPAVDVFSVRLNRNIFTNVGKSEVTPYIDYISTASSELNDTLYVRETGTNNLLLQANGVSATEKRNYTFIWRGSFRGARALTQFANY